MTDISADISFGVADGSAQQKIFKQALFGFKRCEVLDYIEQLTIKSTLEAEKYKEQGLAVQRELDTFKEDNDTLLVKIKEASEALDDEKERASQLSVQLAQLRIDMDKKCDESDAFKSRLFSREQENVVLKADNTRLNATINSLTITANEYETRKAELAHNEQEARIKADSILQEVNGIALATKREAQEAAQLERESLLSDARIAKEKAEQEAQRILDKAGDEAVEMLAVAQREKSMSKVLLKGSCEDIAESIALLKKELADVDNKINEAQQQLQNATVGIANALDNTEKNLDILGVQVKKFPESAPGAKLAREPLHIAPPTRTSTHRHYSIADSILDGLNRILGDK